MEWRNFLVFPRRISVLEIGLTLRIQGSDRLRQVSIIRRRVQIQQFRRIIGQNPRENRKLIQIVVSPTLKFMLHIPFKLHFKFQFQFKISYPRSYSKTLNNRNSRSPFAAISPAYPSV